MVFHFAANSFQRCRFKLAAQGPFECLGLLGPCLDLVCLFRFHPFSAETNQKSLIIFLIGDKKKNESDSFTDSNLHQPWNPAQTLLGVHTSRLVMRWHNNRFPPWLLCFHLGCGNPIIKSPPINLAPASPFFLPFTVGECLEKVTVVPFFFGILRIVPVPGPHYPLHWHSCLSFSPIPSPPVGPWDVLWRRSVKQKGMCEVPTPSHRLFWLRWLMSH